MIFASSQSIFISVFGDHTHQSHRRVIDLKNVILRSFVHFLECFFAPLSLDGLRANIVFTTFRLGQK